MGLNKKLFIGEAAAAFDRLKNFETVTYTGNGGTQKITGYIRKGAAFNGSSSYISTNLDTSNLNTMSYSCWIYTSGTNQQRVISTATDTNGSPSLYTRFDGTRGIRYSSIAGGLWDTGNLNTLLNTWIHVAVTDGGGDNVIIYINGSSESISKVVANGSYIRNTKIEFGRGKKGDGTVGDYFDGKLDQVRIFDKALSSSEVTTLYNETYASSTKSTTDIFGDGSGVALYELDENADDTGGVSGKFDGSAAHFNGSSSSVGNISIDNSTTKAVSIWVNAADFNERWAFQQGDGQSFENYIRFYNTDDIQVRWGGVTQTFSGYSANTWYHIVGQTDASGNANVWINGTEVGTSTAPTPVTVDNTNIGRRRNGSTWQYYFKGRIDDVRIYSDTLTDAEIGYLYNNTTASIPTDNLTAHYKFNGDATDETGTYDGTASNVSYGYDGTPTNVNFLGMAFQPDLVWIKNRFGYGHNHNLIDSVRGASNKLFSNLTNAEVTTGGLASFDSNGFSFDSSSGNDINEVNFDFVAWCWKAGGAAVSNNDGATTAQVSANPAAGFSIISYNPGATTDTTVGHGLGVQPKLYIAKNRNASEYWIVGSTLLANNKALKLNETGAQFTTSGWSNDYPTSSVVSVNINNNTDYILYAFADVDGYQKIGTYSGNNSSQSITTGFKPRFILLKAYNQTDNWVILDSQRGVDNRLYADLSNAESSLANKVTFDTNGFSLTSATYNQSGYSFIYLAIK